MDKNIESQIINQLKLLVPFILVVIYWSALFSVDVGQHFIRIVSALWTIPTAMVMVARRVRPLPSNTVERALELLQKISILAYTAVLLPLFLAMHVDEKNANR